MFDPFNLKPSNETFALALMAGVLRGIIWFAFVSFYEKLNPNETTSI